MARRKCQELCEPYRPRRRARSGREILGRDRDRQRDPVGFNEATFGYDPVPYDDCDSREEW